ncbi:MAG: P-loop NTPase [Chlamydiota bacterium]
MSRSQSPTDGSTLNGKKSNPAPDVIGILAGKGGVGKSTITVELALVLRQKGYKVGVLDGDIYGPSIRHLLPEDTPPKAVGEKVLPAISQGIAVISSAYFPKRGGPVGVRAPIANQIIAQFIEEVEWGAIDFLVVDFPPGTGDIQITLMQRLFFTGAIVVTTPEGLSLLDVQKSMDMCLQMGVPILGVLENMSYYLASGDETRHYLFGRGGGKSLAEAFGVPLIGEIPIDRGLNRQSVEKISAPLFQELGKTVIDGTDREKGCEIKGVDRYHFSIEWSDGKKSLYRFGAVQERCPCSACRMKKETRLVDVEGLAIDPIGNYGVRFRFSKGCSKGIYPFSYLRRLDR